MVLVEPTVVYEDNHLIAVHKPAGWLVQEDETEDAPISEWVKAYIKNRYNKAGNVFLGTIHRLDRPVSGVVVFARTSKALERMNRIFKDRQVEKHYFAVVEQRPEELEGKLTHYLIKDKEKNISKAFARPKYKSAKKSTLRYKLMGSLGDHHLLHVRPETGRSHQIRVQLAKMGCIIRGDVKYGSVRYNGGRHIHLHAFSLTFVHPVKKEKITIEAHPPKEQIWDLFAPYAV